MYCWIFRYEALGFADAWWEAPVPDDLDCAEYDCGPGPWDHNCAYEYLKSMCELAEGHSGDHQFVQQRHVTLVFAEVSDVVV